MNNWASDYSVCVGVCVRACMCVCLLGCLLSSDPSQSDSNSKDFWFNMQALTSYLRKASDQNPSASYYNVDILKYQVSPIPQPNPDEYAVVKECSPKAFHTPDKCETEGKTVMLAHSPQIMHVNHSPEVKSSLKQTQALISKWLIHIFMLVVHYSNLRPLQSQWSAPQMPDLQVWGQNSEDLGCFFLYGLCVCCTRLQLEYRNSYKRCICKNIVNFNLHSFLYLLQYLFVKFHPLLRFASYAMSLSAQP